MEITVKIIDTTDLLKNLHMEIRPNYTIWNSYRHILMRCYNSKDSNYKYYGAKNINMCQDWLYDYSNFYKWSMNNNVKDGLCIDRLDPLGNYCPNNCQWITKSQNRKRQRYDYFYKK